MSAADDDGRGRLRQAQDAVARNLGWLIAGSGVRGVLSLFYLAICTRTLGLEGFGRLALITTASQAIVLIVGFQSSQIVIQYGVDHIARGNEGALARLLRVCALLDLVSAVLGIAIGAVILHLWGHHMGIRPGLMRDTMIFLVVQLVTVRSMPTGILRLRNLFSLAAYAESMLPVVRLAGAALAAALLPTVKGFLYAWIAAELLTAIAYWWAARRGQDLGAVARAKATRTQVLAENPGLVRFAISTNLNTTLSMSSKQFPLLLVGGVLGANAAGAFRLAAQLAQALAKLSGLLTRAAFPEIVRTVREASARLVTHLLGRMFLAASIAALAVLLIVALCGRTLLVLVAGQAYAGAYPVLLWLAFAGCLDLATVGFEPVLLALHRSGTALAIRIGSVVVTVAAALILLRLFGATGVAMAVFAGSLAVAVVLAVATFTIARQERLVAVE